MERAVRGVAGGLVLLSLGLGYYLDPGWYLLTVFVGLSLLQSSITRFCLMEKILKSTVFRDKPAGG